MNISSILSLARDTAMKSTYKQRMSAVIFNKNSIISSGYNKVATSNRKLHPRFKKWPFSIHAEAAAILNARTDLKGCTILVCRLSANNEFTLAKPCNYCLSYLNYVGINKIYYTVPSKPYELMKFK